MSKNLLIICIIVLVHQSIFSQEKTAKGVLIDKKSRQLLEGAKIDVKNTDITVYSDDSGEFHITVPEKHRYLEFSKDSYRSTVTALKPGFQHKTLYTYLVPLNDTDSIYTGIKNAFTLSLFEILNGALALRYEHFLKQKHTIGVRGSFYLFGRNPTNWSGSEYDHYVIYQGVKLSLFYYYYFIRNKGFGLYGEGKLQAGYIHFSKLGYYYGSAPHKLEIKAEESFWSMGFGISAGILFKISKRGVGSFSVGYQYFPIDVPETMEADYPGGGTVTYTADTDWWYRGGPGSYVDVKFTLGIGY